MNFDQLLTNYAKLAVTIGMNVQEGQQVIIRAPIESVDLVRKITDESYKRGASHVTTLYEDDYTVLSKYKNAYGEAFDKIDDWLIKGQENAFENGACRLAILGRNPTLLSDIDPNLIRKQAKVRSELSQKMMKLVTDSHSQWSIISYPTKAWAEQVFPDLHIDLAIEKLWNVIFSTCRVDNDDPEAEWKKHNEKLKRLSDWLNEKQFDELHYVGPETQLVVGLAKDHKWEGGAGLSNKNILFNANIPTEEVFTTPHKDRINGVVKSTKPLIYRGNIIDNFKIFFKNGKAYDVEAEVGKEHLEDLISHDECSSSLGEVALVNNSSPISQSGILFMETLFDENASSHLAFGQSYSKCMMETGEDKEKRGANNSNIHVDFMIGSGHIDVYGIKNDIETPIMKQGEWVIE